MRDMDVTRVAQRWSRTIVLGIGTAAGLVFALPVKTGSVACPPAQEGRTYCLLQHAWAPAGVKLAAAIFVAWLLADLLLVRLPELRRRWTEGERIARRPSDHGRQAVLGDSVLAAASWGIVPERKPAWRVVKPAVPAPAIAGVHALTATQRFARPAGPVAERVRILSRDEARSRRLRRGNDPALVVSCWSDASSAKALPDAISSRATAPLPA